MPAIERGVQSLSFVPDAMREALHRRLRELAGTGLIVLAVILALALATWSVHDPSLSHATNAPVRNALGRGGAMLAHPPTPLVGLAALALVLPPGIWGWGLARHRPLGRQRARPAFCAVAVPPMAARLACM